MDPFSPRAAHRTLPIPALICILLAPSTLHAEAGRPRGPATDPEAEERLQVDAFVGQVLNQFSSSARLNTLNPGDEDEGSNIDLVAGFSFELTAWKRPYDPADPDLPAWRSELALFGQAIHSARVFESPCTPDDPNNPTAEDCVPRSDPDPNADFFKIIRDANTLEWLGGLQWTFATFNKGVKDVHDDFQTGVYVKLQGGFIRASEGGDDLIDNHFYGVGIEQRRGPFAGSFFEVGGGKTDLFAPGERDSRMKISAGFTFTPRRDDEDDEYVSYFAEGWLDSDRGSGSDDIQIYYGIILDLRNIFEKLTKG